MQTVVRGQHSWKLDALRDKQRALQVVWIRFLLNYVRKDEHEQRAFQLRSNLQSPEAS